MLGKLVLGATLITSASAHVTLWDKGMFGYNYPYQASDSNNNYNNDLPVHPLRQSDNLGVDQWFGHGYKGFPPKAGDFLVLPAGGVYTGDINCNRAGSRMRDPMRTDPLPQFACDGEGALHTVNRFNAPVDPSRFGGTALAIAYTSDVNSVQPNDMTVISVNTQSPWFRETSYSIPAGLPPCPSGGCICSWNWIHQTGNGEGYGQEIYNTLYRCIVTGDTDASATIPKPTVPKDCTSKPANCVKGPKTPMYLYQASGNNLPNLDVPPNYNSKWGFSDGAQNDIFSASSTTPVGDASIPTATALPAGWVGMGCYKDQDPRSLPIFLSSSSENTIESCVAGCAAAGNLYAGVEGQECWCAKSNPTLVAAKATECNKPCGGDGWSTCGGDWRLNVYRAASAPTTFAPAVPVSTVVPTPLPSADIPSGWSEVGCVVDQSYPRTLDGGSVSGDNTTVESCIARAQSKGLPYAGVQYGRECWVGSAASRDNIKLGSGCNVACAGDKGTICGGSYRLSVYVNNALLEQADTTTSAGTAAATTSPSSTGATTSTAESTTKVTATTAPTSTSTIASVASTTPTTSTTPSIAPTTTTRATTSTSIAPATSSLSTLPSGWKDLGCNYDSSSPRLLTGWYTNNYSGNGAKWCINFCASKGFSYAGTQYGTQCYCGNSATLRPAPSAQCSSTCPDGVGKCGGNYRINVYSNAEGAGVGKKRDLSKRRLRFGSMHGGDGMRIH